MESLLDLLLSSGPIVCVGLLEVFLTDRGVSYQLIFFWSIAIPEILSRRALLELYCQL